MNARDPAEPYYELADYELRREYIKDKDGVLTSAFDGELYFALQALGVACADDSRDRDAVALAVDAFRDAVNREAAQYAAKRASVRALEMAEDDE